MSHYASSTIIEQQRKLIQLQEALLAETQPPIWPPPLRVIVWPVTLPQDDYHQKRVNFWNAYFAWNFGLLFSGVGVLMLPFSLLVALPLREYHVKRANYRFNGLDGRPWIWQLERYYDRGPNHHQWLPVWVSGTWTTELSLQADSGGRAWVYGESATKSAANEAGAATATRLEALFASASAD